MPNAFKYSLTNQTLALKKGNFYIGTGDVGKGPTSSTGYYNGVTPPAGGYTIYLNKESNGPSIYSVSTESQLISITNTIGGQSFTTLGQSLNWFVGQTDKLVLNKDYPAIITDGLV
jgi:energy-coupling factor transporter ATP-binding protein EcfA2